MAGKISGPAMASMNRLKDFVPHTDAGSSSDRTEEFVRLFSQCQPLVRGFIYTLLPSRDEADELFQRTSIVLWRKFPQFVAGTNFAAWACQIAKLEVRNFLRVRSRDRHQFSDEMLASLADIRIALDSELELRREALRHCIAKLRPTDKEIIHQCYGPQATTAKDAASRLGRPVNTLYKALIRIRRTLFDCIEHAIKAGDH